MSGWRDIATAPKDGTWMLTWDGDNYDVTSWCGDHHLPEGGEWMTALCAIYPTHWMPLPEAPTP